MTTEEAGKMIQDLEARIHEGRLHNLSLCKLRKLQKRFYEAGSTLLVPNADPDWYRNLRDKLLDAIETKRVETSERNRTIGLAVLAALVAIGIGWWTHDKKSPQTSSNPQPTASPQLPTPLLTTPKPKVSPRAIEHSLRSSPL